MVQDEIKKICVIGSGVMDSGIAALVANSSHQVILLDIVSNDPHDSNAIVRKVIANIKKQHPAALSHINKLDFITIGTLEDDIQLILECDLIIEVIIEKIEIKHQLYNKIIPYLLSPLILQYFLCRN